MSLDHPGACASPNLRLARLIDSLALREGVTATHLDGVHVLRAIAPIPRTPVLYEPSIVIAGQGAKHVYLGQRVYTYDARNFLVVSVPLPAECATAAEPTEPLLAVAVRIDFHVLAELLAKSLALPPPLVTALPEGVYAAPLDPRLADASARLLECLSDPSEARILGPQIVREILYRVLRGPHGNALRAAAATHGRFWQVNRAIERIQAEYARPLTVDDLARTAGVSPSAFHQHFKAVTANPPLQYLKAVRLHKALMFMIFDGLRAGAAAARVGYESPSQFCREFKRMFGHTPGEQTELLRGVLGVSELRGVARPVTI